MLQHYLKIAFRNLLKYKMQTLVSIAGLAIGFTCFALAMLWTHYEMTYDCQVNGSERLYLLYKKSVSGDTGYSTGMPYPASTILKTDFPEVEEACALTRYYKKQEIKTEGQPAIHTFEMQADSCFMKMFQVSVLSGSMEFMYSDEEVALTEETALQLFGSTDVLGKEIMLPGDRKTTVCAILKSLEHSNLTFGYWGQGQYFRRWQNDWTNGGFQVIIKLRQGIDPDAFQKKLSAYNKKGNENDVKNLFADIRLMPLSKYRYSAVNESKSIEFYYLILFSISGGLVILCSLFNYLSLFITRMQMRSREIGLRKVCGSSIGSLFALFGTEYLCMIAFSGLLGMTLVELALPAFRDMSGVTGNIYGESFLYFAGILLLSLFMLLPFLLRHSHVRNNAPRQFRMRKASIILQLSIGVLFIFCMTVIMKQIYFLTNTDLGWERKNIATIPYLYPNNDFEIIANKIEQLSCTQEVLSGHCGLLPRSLTLSSNYKDWEGKDNDDHDIEALCLSESEKVIPFYKLKLLAGNIPHAEEQNNVMVNEAAAKAFGMNDPIGKKLYRSNGHSETIVGLIKDFHTTPPTIPVQPTILTVGKFDFGNFNFGKGLILIKYKERKWQELKNKIDDIFTQGHSEVKYKLENTEDLYAEYLKSEKIMMKLLSFIAIVCILISAFGIFSFVTLSCELRRKEIAVRKVNGAQIRNVLTMFVKEYFLLLLAASAIAFPIGYVLMKHWLENYIKQTDINAWIYMAIFAGIAAIIALCIGWRVWQAARQNPAEVIKSE